MSDDRTNYTAAPRPSLSGQDQPSFAYSTITGRMPAILAQVRTLVFNRLEKVSGPAARASGAIFRDMVDLDYDMKHDRPLKFMEEERGLPDIKIWNNVVSNLQHSRTWHAVPWLVCECYMYRRIMHAFMSSKDPYWAIFDPFAEQKDASIDASLTAFDTLARTCEKLVLSDGTEDQDGFAAFEEIISVALWGNQADLSLFQAMSASDLLAKQAVESTEFKAMEKRIVVNDTRKIWERIRTLRNSAKDQSKPRRVDIVLDNAGFELFGDFLLAHWLLQSNVVDQVHLHAKEMPWFVSDATPRDIEELLKRCSATPDSSLAQLAQAWRDEMSAGRIVVRTDPFWTMPWSYWHLDQSPLFDEFKSKSDLIFFKGDLNYRKLIFDCAWDFTTPFSEAIGPKMSQLPIVALRTCKCDIVVGLQSGQDEAICEDDPEWMINGKYAVIAANLA
ncbi:DUF89-domain-containing protein [Ramicandelaber brevisporus]|nr:DUF89-domain-containing protein [Ramicandelaber brevisporus]